MGPEGSSSRRSRYCTLVRLRHHPCSSSRRLACDACRAHWFCVDASWVHQLLSSCGCSSKSLSTRERKWYIQQAQSKPCVGVTALNNFVPPSAITYQDSLIERRIGELKEYNEERVAAMKRQYWEC